MPEEPEVPSTDLDSPAVADPFWIPPQVPRDVVAPAPHRRHSKLGIAAFILSLLFGSAMFGGSVLSAIIQHSAVRYQPEAFRLWMSVIGYGFMFALAAELLALGLGIGGLCESGTNRLFAILGVVFSCGGMALFLTLMIVGLLIRG